MGQKPRELQHRNKAQFWYQDKRSQSAAGAKSKLPVVRNLQTETSSQYVPFQGGLPIVSGP
ncbi:unnamed protein product [Spodoptera exigua]|nr:unnamed protein product [Spodoptera exigua]